MPSLVEQLKALGEEHRYRIMMMLRTRALCVCEMGEVLDIAGATLSTHLKVLRYAGLVGSRRDGKWIEYFIRDEGIENLVDGLYERMQSEDPEGQALVDADRSALAHITREVCSTRK